MNKTLILILIFSIYFEGCKKTDNSALILNKQIVADTLGNGFIKIILDTSFFDNSPTICAFQIKNNDSVKYSMSNILLNSGNVTIPVKTRHYVLEKLLVRNGNNNYECNDCPSSSISVFNNQTVILQPHLTKIILPDTLFIKAYSQNKIGVFYDINASINITSNKSYNYNGNLSLGINTILITQPTDSLYI